jgi:hypothetical protein
MGTVKVREDIKSAQIDAVIIRADGSRENLGTVAYYHKNPLKRLQFRIKELFRHGNRSS